MFKLTGNEKAIIGGFIAGLATIIVQLQQSGQLTLKEGAYALAAFVVTHISVWVATNTPKTPTV